MPFKRVNETEEICKRIENDDELKKEYMKAQRLYNFVKKIAKLRHELGITQKEIAQRSGLTQQMISRIESATYSPTLKNFLDYIDGVGLEIKLERKNEDRKLEKQLQ